VTRTGHLDREPTSAAWCAPDRRTFLFEPSSEQKQPAFHRDQQAVHAINRWISDPSR
jgi:hypothetical protein